MNQLQLRVAALECVSSGAISMSPACRARSQASTLTHTHTHSLRWLSGEYAASERMREKARGGYCEHGRLGERDCNYPFCFDSAFVAWSMRSFSCWPRTYSRTRKAYAAHGYNGCDGNDGNAWQCPIKLRIRCESPKRRLSGTSLAVIGKNELEEYCSCH